MANYWTDYSFIINNLTDSQVEWWKNKLTYLEKLDETDGFDPKDLDEEGNPKDGAEAQYDGDDGGSPASCFRLNKKERELWVTGAFNEGGNIKSMIESYVSRYAPIV